MSPISTSYGAALKLSQLLSDLVPRLPSPPFSGGLRSWVFSLQGFTAYEAPGSSSLQATLLTFLPAGFVSSLPRERIRQAPGPHLGSSGPHLLVFRVLVLVRAGFTWKPRLMSYQETIPSWVFSSSWFTPSRWVKPSFYDRHASGRLARSQNLAFHGTPLVKAVSLFQGRPSISRFLASCCTLSHR